jgi:ABC-2 type transport system permease protein
MVPMNKTVSIARYEYMHHVGNKRFWISLAGVPLGFVLLFGLSLLLSRFSFDTRPVGIVDNAGLIQIEPDNSEKSTFFSPQIYLHVFPDESTARAAVEADEIQGFAILPEDYLSRFQIIYWSNKQPLGDIQSVVTDFVSKNLMVAENIESTVVSRIDEGSQISMQSLDGSQNYNESNRNRIAVPIVVGVLNFILVMTCGGYLLQALVEEKESRTLEIMLTSVPSREMMAGKIIGNLGIGFTQIAAWILLLGIAGFIFRDKLDFLAGLNLSASYLAVSIALTILSFIFAATLMVTIGAMMTGSAEAQGVTGLMVIPMMLPVYFFGTFISNPDGIIPRVLSFFPLSSPLAIALRMAISTVSQMEILLAFVVIITLTLLMIWLAGVVFKRGMLLFTPRLSLRKKFNKETRNA